MERRLLNFIMVPAMTVTWVIGIVLVLEGQWFGAGWFHAKFIAVHRHDGPPWPFCALGK